MSSASSVKCFAGLMCAGSDALGWAMYIDGSRSWFVHGGAHGGRAAGGIARGSTVGVLLDLTRGTLSFTVDDQPQVRSPPTTPSLSLPSASV